MGEYSGYQVVYFTFRRYDTFVVTPCLNHRNLGVSPAA